MLISDWLLLLGRRISRRQRRLVRSKHSDLKFRSVRRSRPLSFERLEDRTLLSAPNPFDLSTLNGTNGFRLDGIDADDTAGISIFAAGDVNGDGFADLIVGAFGADPGGPGNTQEGETYVVFGKASGFASAIDLSTLNGTNGFRLDGIDPGDFSGVSVSGAGDVNGDGFDDLIIGAFHADSGAGESYVVFGKASGFTSTFDLSSLDGANGFRLSGIDPFDYSGTSVSGAGDVNGDGFADLIVGAFWSVSNLARRGETYVVFGKAIGFTATFDLATLDGTNGFRLDGIDAYDLSGHSVSGAGDINGDGLDDLIIGAEYGDPGAHDNAGESYVVFGQRAAFAAAFNLSTLNGTNGFVINGIDASDRSGVSVSGAGDINGDGFDDLIVGAWGGDPGGDLGAGESYVVFGKAGGFAAALNLSSLDGTNGFRLDGIDSYDFSGQSVSGAGDVNGDGFDDLIIGAYAADREVGMMTEYSVGESYVVFGKASGFTATFDLASLNGTNGFRLDGIDGGDSSGFSVSGARDVNGDGFDDLIIGAHTADAGGDNDAGETYVVFGGNFTGGVETQVGGTGPQTLTANQGAGARDVLVGGQGADTLISDGGSDILRGGQGSDTLAIADVNFSGTRRISGGLGTDTLRLDGSGLHLDLTTIADNRVEEIEIIDLTGSGNNILTLDLREVLNLSGHSNSLTVLGNAGDRVRLETNWVRQANELIGGTTFQVLTQGAAVLKISSAVRVVPSTIDLAALRDGDGTTIFGADALDNGGWSVSNAGDVNGDGFDDLLIGAPLGDSAGNATGNAGESYLVFGGASLPATIDLANLGLAGITIFGADENDSSGWSVSSAGDVNGDGFDDLLIGARSADAVGNLKPNAGETYLIFGGSNLPATIDLANLGPAGITIFGADNGDASGFSVSNGGDVNGDGFDDLLIAAHFADAAGDGKIVAGDTYVVFGATNLPATIDLGSLGALGITIFGADASDRSGSSVAGAGDVNGDGFDDLLIGAYFAAAAGNLKGTAGESYLIFGGANLPATIDLANLGTLGITIFGADNGDFSGRSVSSAGDVNGDGFDDLLIGADQADAAGNLIDAAGEAYLIFGGASLPATISLANIGTLGIKFFGANSTDWSGYSVSGAGDVNGDGFDDLLVGARRADAAGELKFNAGETYLIFGRASLPSTVDLTNLGLLGIKIFGVDGNDDSGSSVSSAGDVNGDGFDDLLIGARFASAEENAKSYAGESYLLFGGDYTLTVTHLGTGAGEVLNGNGSANVIIGGLGGDTLVGNGGGDVLRGGQGNDTLAVSDLMFFRLNGGTGVNTLRLDGGDLHLDLTAIADNRIQEIEIIDISGSGDNTLTLDWLEVLNLSSQSNVLTVLRNRGDVVNIGSDWTSAGKIFDGQFFDLYTHGAAILRVQDPTITVVGNTATIWGTPARDSIVYRIANRQANVNSVNYVLPSNIDLININGLGDKDTLNLIGTPGPESITTGSGMLSVEYNAAHSGFDVIGQNLEVIILDGQGGGDVVTFNDTTGSDKFFARPTSGFMIDVAGQFETDAFGFQMTGAFTSGNDLVKFFDSPGNDTVTAHPTVATIQGAGFLHTARNFDVLVARSLNGSDVANVFGTTGNDAFSGRGGIAVLSSVGFNYQLDGFRTITADGLGGNDLARLIGGPGNDMLTAGPSSAQFLTGGFTLSTISFERLIATAGTGANDVAILSDSTGDDLFAGTVSSGELSGLGFFERTNNFDTITIRGVNGGTNRRVLNNIAFALIEQGTWV